MVLGVFVCCEFDYVGFKVIRGQGQGQNSRSFWPINNPYFDVLKLAKSRNNRYEYLYILKDMILKFKKKKKKKKESELATLAVASTMTQNSLN